MNSQRHDETTAGGLRTTQPVPSLPARQGASPEPSNPLDALRLRLSAKLLLLTILFVMLAEVLIFVPSIANFRMVWLTERLTAARIAALAAEANDSGEIPADLRSEILNTAQVRAVAIKRADRRGLVMLPDDMPVIDASYDLRVPDGATVLEVLTQRISAIGDALYTLLPGAEQTIRVIGLPSRGLSSRFDTMEYVEIVLPEAPLRQAMLQHGLNILLLSIIISLIAACLVYFALNRLLVRPMMRITDSMVHFAANPEDVSRIIVASDRTDEIGVAERQLAQMQSDLNQLLHQRSRLAQLGLAVSKINHDLRNMLASAQLLSDRLAALPDPTVQRFAPKLIASLDRAIAFCNDTLRFGQAAEPGPRREVFGAQALVQEVGDGLGLPCGDVHFVVEIDRHVMIDADREQMYRVLNNIVRNAVAVLDGSTVPGAQITVAAWREGLSTLIEVRDNGPGVPGKVRERLFQAFQSGARKGGTGLGLAIAQELVTAHGGKLELRDSAVGAVFRITMPDRRAAG